MCIRDRTWDAALGASVGAGLGVLLAVVLFAFVRSRIDERLVPAALRGLPITCLLYTSRCV